MSTEIAHVALQTSLNIPGISPMFAECLLSTLIFSEHSLNTEKCRKNITTSDEYSCNIKKNNGKFIYFIIISRF